MLITYCYREEHSCQCSKHEEEQFKFFLIELLPTIRKKSEEFFTHGEKIHVDAIISGKHQIQQML